MQPMKGFGFHRRGSPGGLLGASELAGLCGRRRWIQNKLRVDALLDPFGVTGSGILGVADAAACFMSYQKAMRKQSHRIIVWLLIP